MNNKMHGKGILFYENGNTFEGEFENDEKNGFGVYIYLEREEKYEGYYKNDKRNGKGKFYGKNGTVFDGKIK